MSNQATLDKLLQLGRERDDWRARAERAEAKLAPAREALAAMIDWHERGDAETWPSADFDRFRHDMDSARQALSHLTGGDE